MTATSNLSFLTAPRLRLETLDGLRGIGAIIIVLSHLYISWPDRHFNQIWWVTYTPLRIFINGHAWVIMFFVLSGYVLSLPFFRGTQPTYFRYLIRRFCRIYLTFAAATAFAIYLYIKSEPYMYPVADTSVWFNQVWPTNWPGAAVVLGHFMMLGSTHDMEFNPVMWTLVYELRISFLFPFLVLICRRSWLAAALAVILFAGSVSLQMLTQSTAFWITVLLTVEIIPYFFIGILACKHRDQIRAWLHRLPLRNRRALLVIPVIIFLIPNLYPYQSFYDAAMDGLFGIGSAVAIIFALEMPEAHIVLGGRVVTWLGRISYSIYLVHLPIILMLFHMRRGWPFATVGFLSVIMTLIAATILHYTVEAPATKLGHIWGSSKKRVRF